MQNGGLPKAARKTPRALSAISGNAAASGSSRPSSSIPSASLSSMMKTKMPPEASNVKIPKAPPLPPPQQQSAKKVNGSAIAPQHNVSFHFFLALKYRVFHNALTDFGSLEC